MPQRWNEIHQKLVAAAAARNDSTIPKPPVPLILNGWVFTDDSEKRQRWNETLEWANKYDFSQLILELKAEDIYEG